MRYLLAFLLTLPVLGQLMMPHRVGSQARRAAWYDTNWSSRTMLQVSSPNTVTNYAVKLDLTASNFDFSKSNGDGSDLRITDSTGTNLVNYYVRAFDTNAQTGEIWVRPVLVNSWAPTTLYLYYGNASPAAFTLPPTGIFTRPAAASVISQPEDILYDAATSLYYVAGSTNSSTRFSLYSASTLTGPWSDAGNILSNSVAGWDSRFIHSCCLFKDGSTWYLYYGGNQTGSDGYQIGYATSSDITGPYVKSVSNPVLTLGATNTWDAYRVFEPYVKQVGSTWYMFFCGNSTDYTSPVEQVGYATASDPTGPWTKYAGNPVIPLDGALTADDNTVADPYLVGLVNGWYYIGYSSGIKRTAPWTISMAQTRDFINFFRCGSIYSTGIGSEWDTTDAHKGSISLFTNVYYMAYHGTNAVTAASGGIATMSAVSTASGFDPNQVFDYYDDFSEASRDTNRWGLSLDNGFDSIAAGILTMNSGTNTVRRLIGRRLFGVNKIVEALCRHTSYNGVSNAREGVAGLSDALHYFRIYDYNNAKFQRGVDSTIVSMADNASANWVTHRMYLQSTTQALFQNDSGAWETMALTASYTNAIPAFLQSYSSGAGKTNVFDVDYVLVREYRTNEPTVTVIGAR